MKQFISYWQSLNPNEKRVLAAKAKTTTNYNSRIVNGHRGISLKRAYAIVQAEPSCSGLIAPDTLMRDNNRQPLRCHYESETKLQTILTGI